MRIDPFFRVHNGLRALLYDTGLLLQRTDFGQQEQEAKAYKRLGLVVMLFESHAFNEDKFILPPVLKVAPELAERFKGEHAKDLQLAEALLSESGKLYGMKDVETKRAGAATLLRTFNAFCSFNLEHMYEEEEHLNKILWQLYTDDQLRELNDTIVRSIAAEKKSVYGSWMMKGLSAPVIVEWLEDVRSSAPESAYFELLHLAGQHAEAQVWLSVSRHFAS